VLWRGFLLQWRVVGALLIREIYSRFGRESIGFAWIVAESLVFAITVLLTWRAVRNLQDHGLDLMPLLWSGFVLEGLTLLGPWLLRESRRYVVIE
jgi:capsular polysaccharide transport system permease protein